MEAFFYFVASLPKTEQIGILFMHEENMTMVNVSQLCTAKISYASVSKVISFSPYVVWFNDASFELRMLPTERFVGFLKAKGVKIMQSESSLAASKTYFQLYAYEGRLAFDVIEQKFDEFRYSLNGQSQAMPWSQISVKKSAQQLVLSTILYKGVRYQSVADYRAIHVSIPDCGLLEHLFVYFAAMTGFVQKVVLNSEISAYQYKSQKYVVYELNSIYEKPRAASSIENRFSQLLKTLSHEDIEQEPLAARNGLTSKRSELLVSRRGNSTAALLASMLLRTDPCLYTSARFAYHGCHVDCYNADHFVPKADKISWETLQFPEPNKSAKQQGVLAVSQGKKQLFASEDSYRLARRSVHGSFCYAQPRFETIEPLAVVTKMNISALNVYFDYVALETAVEYLKQDISNYQYREYFGYQALEFYQTIQLNRGSKYELVKIIVWLYKFGNLESFCKARGVAAQFASVNCYRCSIAEAVRELMVELAALVTAFPPAKNDIYSALINVLVAGYVLQFVTGTKAAYNAKNCQEAPFALLISDRSPNLQEKQRLAQIEQMLLLLEAAAIERYAVLQFEMHNFIGFTGSMQAAIDRFEALEASCACRFISESACKYLPGRARRLKHKLYKASADILLKQNKAAQAFADAAYCSSIGGRISLEKYTSRFCEILQESRYSAIEIGFCYLFCEFGIKKSYFVLCKPINFASMVQNRQKSEQSTEVNQVYKVDYADSQDAYVYVNGAFCRVQTELHGAENAKTLSLKQSSSAFSIELHVKENIFAITNKTVLYKMQSIGGEYTAVGVECQGSKWVLALPQTLCRIFLY